MNNQQEKSYPVFHFDHEPTYAETWDKCAHQLYDIDSFATDLEGLFSQLGVVKTSRIIDTAAGAGFPSHNLIKRGYEIICTDASDDMIELFKIKAVQAGIAQECRKALWLELPELFPDTKFDYLMCRGNSFIYADGGWNKHEIPDSKRAIQNYLKTLKVFHKQLKNGGWVHLDKYKDEELGHKIKVAEIQVNDRPVEDLIFWTQRHPETKVRRAEMIRKVGENTTSIPNITYDLLGSELEDMMTEAGFQNIQKISLPSEKLFDIWIGQKL